MRAFWDRHLFPALGSALLFVLAVLAMLTRNETITSALAIWFVLFWVGMGILALWEQWTSAR